MITCSTSNCGYLLHEIAVLKVVFKTRFCLQEIIRFEVEEIKSEIGKDTKGLVGIKEILKRAKYR